METLMIILSGILITVGTYLLLSKNLIQIVIGTAVFTHAGHILLITMGGLEEKSVPLLGENAPQYVDALPQALILTSIVISFGVTAFFLVVAYRTYEELGTNNIYYLRGRRDE